MKLHRFIALTVAIVALQATAVCAQDTNSQDVRFLRQAARLGVYQFELGQLALSLGPTQEIRDYGLQETADHSGINRQLEELGEFYGVDLPSNVTRSQQRVLNRLTALADTDSERFARALLKESIRTHKQIIQLCAKEARRGEEPGIVDFAQRFLGILRNHLAEARELLVNL